MIFIHAGNLPQHNFSDESIDLSYNQMIKKTDLGFLSLPFAHQFLSESEKLGAHLKSNYEHLVVVGIGGSSMGPRAIAEICGKRNISFIDNVDAIETDSLLSELPSLEKVAWLFISKSGSTIEVLWNLELIKQHYKNMGKDLWKQSFFITENANNPLRQLAYENKRPCLEIPLDVGGRFSVLSPVGLVVAEYLNYSGKNLLSGAQKSLNEPEKIKQIVKQYLDSFERNEDITLFWFYSSRMRWFGCWLQQLWAESLGKKSTLSNDKAPSFSTPMISIGSCDQHSILQQVIEGPKNKFVNIFRFKSVENSSHFISNTNFKETKILNGMNYGELIKAEAIATQKALEASQVSTLLFEVPDLKSESLGYLFMFYQLVVSCIGQHTNINAFNQPAVALAKELTLEEIRKDRSN